MFIFVLCLLEPASLLIRPTHKSLVSRLPIIGINSTMWCMRLWSDEVNLRLTRLVLWWVTCPGSIPSAGHLSRYVTSYPVQLRLAIPSWVGKMRTSLRAVTPCGWGIKAGMVHILYVWLAGKTVWSNCYTRAVSQRFRGVAYYLTKRYRNSRYFTLPRNPDITYGLFRRQLKGHLFREAWTRRSVTSNMRRLRLTYLLTYFLAYDMLQWQPARRNTDHTRILLQPRRGTDIGVRWNLSVLYTLIILASVDRNAT